MANLKNIGLIGLGAAGAAALTVGAAGIAGAQEDEPTLTDPTTEAVEDDATDAVEEDTDTERPSRQERQQARIDELIEDGVITQEQADDLSSIREAIQADREAKNLEKQQEIADVLGVTLEELEAAREDGTSLYELAGDDLDALVEYFTAEATERANEAVAEGKITQEQAEERLDGLAERIESRLENGGGFGTREGRGGHGRGGHGHHGGDFGSRGDRTPDATADAEAQETSFT